MYEKPGLYKHWDFMLIDIVVLEACYFLAFYLRHHRKIELERSSYAAVILLIVLLVLVSGVLFRNYSHILQRGYGRELGYVIRHVSVVTAGLIIYLFVIRDQGMFSRLVLGYFYVISIPVLYAVRILYKNILRRKNTTGYNRRKAILLTSSGISSERVERLKEDVSGVAEISGVVYAAAGNGDGEYYCGIPVFSSYENLADSIRNQWVDEVFVLLSNDEEEQEKDVLRELSVMGITMHYALNIDNAAGRSRFIEPIGGMVFMTESIRTITLGQAAAKRILDIIGALVGLVFTGIFTVIFGPAIFIADPGPIFYKQKRVGRNGRVFNMYKFRSMYKDADKRKAGLMKQNEMSGLMFKMKNDPRILGSGKDGTRHGIGWLIRTTSIDEFPQFLNVLLGQLSLVGTRPPTLDEWNQYESHHRARMAVKPGITGLWQVSGRNRITNFEDVVKLDMEYIDNFSLAEDLRILLRTVRVVLKHEGAE